MYENQDGWSNQTLDDKQDYDKHTGNGVIDGGVPSESAQPFGVDTTAVTGLVGGEYAGNKAHTASFRDAVDTDEPRKGVVYLTIDDDGGDTISTAVGEPEPIQYAPDAPRESVFESFRPAPPALWGADVVPLAEVYLPANAGELDAEHIRDRRIPADAAVATLGAREVKTNTLRDAREGITVEPSNIATLDDLNQIGNTTVETATDTHGMSDKEVALADSSGGKVVIVLPEPSSGIKATVKCVDASHGVDITTPGEQTIDGAESLTLSTRHVSRTITSDGSNYFII